MFLQLKLFNTLFYMLIILLLAIAFLLGLRLNSKVALDKEKASPFECGFDPLGIRRLPFCIKFFLVAVIFLVFDVEVALLIPITMRFIRIQVFLLILILGLLYEWFFGGLD